MGIPAGGSGAIIAAAMAKKRKRIIRAFAKAGATSQETAKTLAELGLHGKLMLQVEKLRGVLVKVDVDRYYLDETREIEVANFRRKLVLMVLAVIAIIFLLVRFFAK